MVNKFFGTCHDPVFMVVADHKHRGSHQQKAACNVNSGEILIFSGVVGSVRPRMRTGVGALAESSGPSCHSETETAGRWLQRRSSFIRLLHQVSVLYQHNNLPEAFRGFVHTLQTPFQTESWNQECCTCGSLMCLPGPKPSDQTLHLSCGLPRKAVRFHYNVYKPK